MSAAAARDASVQGCYTKDWRRSWGVLCMTKGGAMEHGSRDRGSLEWLIEQGFIQGGVVGAVGYLFVSAMQMGGKLPDTRLITLTGFFAGFAIGMGVARASAGAGARLARSIYAPSGASTAYVPTFSQIEALEIRGDLDGAASAWDEEIARSGDQIGVLVKAADFHLRARKDAQRALELFQRARATGSGGADMRRYVQQKLVDLYLGPLKDEGRALVELRRLIDAFPGTREAEAARDSLAAIKASRSTDSP